jgi:hypothetical protein
MNENELGDVTKVYFQIEFWPSTRLKPQWVVNPLTRYDTEAHATVFLKEERWRSAVHQNARIVHVTEYREVVATY